MIDVNKLNATTYEVRVGGEVPTTHKVTLTSAYHKQLAGENASPEQLVEASFRFLLEREPNTSILRSFDLPAIGRYFPEYERSIKTML